MKSYPNIFYTTGLVSCGILLIYSKYKKFQIAKVFRKDNSMPEYKQDRKSVV